MIQQNKSKEKELLLKLDFPCKESNTNINKKNNTKQTFLKFNKCKN